MCSSTSRRRPRSLRSLSTAPSLSTVRRDASIHFSRRRRPVAGQEEQTVDGRPETAAANGAQQPPARGSRARAHPRQHSCQEVRRATSHVPLGVSSLADRTWREASSPTATAQGTTWSRRYGARCPRGTTPTRHNKRAAAASSCRRGGPRLLSWQRKQKKTTTIDNDLATRSMMAPSHGLGGTADAPAAAARSRRWDGWAGCDADRALTRHEEAQ